MTNDKTKKAITVIGERDASGRYWILRITENGRMDVVNSRFRRRDTAIRAAKRLGGKVQFWHG